MDAFAREALDAFHVQGLGLAVLTGDKVLLCRGYGRDRVLKGPFTPSSPFQIASNTKLFTAMAAGMLVAEGRLGWDQPVHEVVPSIRFARPEWEASVSLRDLLAHRTGIQRHEFVGLEFGGTRAELVDKLRFLEPSAPLRQRFEYSNLQYVAVGQVIEVLSGQTWEAFVRDRIFRPLGMEASSFTTSDLFAYDPQAGSLHTEVDRGAAMAPCGGIVSTLDDLTRWLNALMNEGRYLGRQVLPGMAVREALVPAIMVPDPGEAPEVAELSYGLGCFTESYRGHRLAYHLGDAPGNHSVVSWLPGEGLGVILLVQGGADSRQARAMVHALFDRLLGLEPRPWAQRWRDQAAEGRKAKLAALRKHEAEQVPGTRPAHALEAYAGSYVNPAYGTLKITCQGNGLVLDLRTLRQYLVHFQNETFDTLDGAGNGSVAFQSDARGAVDQATVTLGGARVVFQRQPLEHP